jgi:hypothetical protein
VEHVPARRNQFLPGGYAVAEGLGGIRGLLSSQRSDFGRKQEHEEQQG